MSVKLACTPTTLLFFLTPVWLVQYQDKMYRMRGNADSASLFLDSVSRWCSLLARKQWVMLKPMDVNCQATGAWQYILFGSIKTALYPTRYNMSFWSVNIQLADPLPVFCRGVTLVGFVWLSASQISWSRMFAKHFIHPLSHQSSTFLFLTVKHIFCLPTRSLETCMYCWCIWTPKMQILEPMFWAFTVLWFYWVILRLFFLYRCWAGPCVCSGLLESWRTTMCYIPKVLIGQYHVQFAVYFLWLMSCVFA